MLGPAKPRRLDVPIAVSLEQLVPADHVYRHLEATLDLDFVREWTRELDAARGRPSIAPVVFFKHAGAGALFLSVPHLPERRLLPHGAPDQARG